MSDIEGDLHLLEPMSEDIVDMLESCGASLRYLGTSMCIDLGDGESWKYVDIETGIRALKEALKVRVPGIGFCFSFSNGRIVNCALNEPLRCHYWTAPTRSSIEGEIECSEVHEAIVGLFSCCGQRIKNRTG